MIAAGQLGYIVKGLEELTDSKKEKEPTVLLNWNKNDDQYVHEHDASWRGIELLEPEAE